jgi:hypothetical protein
MTSPAAAQPARQRPAPMPATPVQAPPQPTIPDMLVVMKLIWSSMVALDHANQTGNYSVLRDLGAPAFQAGNDAATLGSLFQDLRTQRLDVANSLLVAPVFEIPPTIVESGLLRVRGSFPLRPTSIGFDLLFQNIGGQWRLFGIAVVPLQPQLPQTGSTRR